MHRPEKWKVILFALLAVVPAWVAGAWWDKTWSYRKALAIDATAAGVSIASPVFDVPVVVRLHTGNFGYFLDTHPDGNDLRFVAGEDGTPLQHHIESYDPIAGVALLWVRVPTVGTGTRTPLWLYYGNERAPRGDDRGGTYDARHTAVFHFSEREGPPRDATSFGHHPVRSDLQPGVPGQIDAGAALDGSSAMVLAPGPALVIDPKTGFTLSLWLRPSTAAEEGVLFTQRDGERRLEVGLTADRPYARLVDGATEVVAQAGAALAVGGWHHLAVTLDEALRVYVDGQETASTPAALAPLGGELILGASASGNGFKGTVDELRLSGVVRSGDSIRLAAKGEGPDGKLVVYGEDETASGAGGLAAYLALLWVLLGSVSVDGWVIMGITAVLGLVSVDVILSKVQLLRRVERADRAFHDAFGELFAEDVRRLGDPAGARADDPPPVFRHSTLEPLYQAAMREIETLLDLAAQAGGGRRLTREAFEVIRSSLDAELVEQVNRLNARLVLVTIAVSGGPFLGLLGTVVGVMTTFANIAAVGDVNVNTIAPGVAAALTTTVVGLVVAIPSLFGYNYVASRVSARTATMEVFVDELASRLAMTRLTPAEATHAP